MTATITTVTTLDVSANKPVKELPPLDTREFVTIHICQKCNRMTCKCDQSASDDK